LWVYAAKVPLLLSFGGYLRIILNSNGANNGLVNGLVNEKLTAKLTATIVLYKPENEWLESLGNSEKVVVGSMITARGSMIR